MTPPALVGDIGGGALYLAIGLLAAVMNVRAGGRGQVVDAAIVDGSAHIESEWVAASRSSATLLEYADGGAGCSSAARCGH